jgi:hypothetical protein
MCWYNNTISNALTLSNTVFPISVSNGTTTIVGNISQTAPAIFTDLPIGTYTITETLPTGYTQVSMTPPTVVLDSNTLNQTVLITNNKTPIPTGTILINKGFNNWLSTSDMFTDALTHSFNFTITGPSGFIRMVSTNPYNPLTVMDLPYGTYTITEAADATYPLISITPNIVTIGVGNTYQTVNILNTYTPPPTGTITIHKMYNS